MQERSLAESINDKLILYAKKILFVPNFILSYGLSEKAVNEFRNLFPQAHIENHPLSELNTSKLSIKDDSVDLLLVNLSYANFSLKKIFPQVKRILHKNGLGIFATFTRESKLLLEKGQNLNDETSLIEITITDPTLRLLSQNEHLILLSGGGYIDCCMFIISNLIDINYLKRLIKFSLEGEGEEDALVLVSEIEIPEEKKEREHEEDEFEEEIEEPEEEHESKEHEEEHEEEHETEEHEESEKREEEHEASELEESEKPEEEHETEEHEEAEEEHEAAELEESEEPEEEHETKEHEESEEPEEEHETEELKEPEEPEEEHETEELIESEEPEEEHEAKEQEEPEEHETEKHEAEEHAESKEQEEPKEHDNPESHKPEPAVHVLADALAAHKEILDEHANTLAAHVESTAPILKQLMNANLNAKDKQIKLNQLKKLKAEHQQLLDQYKAHLDEHQALLKNFLTAQRKTLSNEKTNDKYHEIIKHHEELLSKHEEEAQKHDDFQLKI